MDEKERSRALELALGQIEKQFGKGSILRLGSKDAIVPVSVISTGSISLDAALGVGGFPRGRINEIFGPESSGKTTIALQVVAEAQKAGGIAAFIDVEHALDPAYARKLGVDVDNLLVSQPDYGEQALEITSHLIASGQIDVLVVDSVAALVPKSELDGEMGDSHMGLQARLMSQALRKLTGSVSKSNTCLIFINQIREKIGVMFGNPETTTGGRALKFYSSVRLDIRRIAAIKDGDAVVGNRTKVKVVKNKVASPFREAEFDIIYGEGVSKEGDLLDLGVAQNIIEKSGSWFSYKGDRIGQGRENARQFLKDNPDIRHTIDTELRKALGLIKADGAPVAAPVEAPAGRQAGSGAGARFDVGQAASAHRTYEEGRGAAAGHPVATGAYAGSFAARRSPSSRRASARSMRRSAADFRAATWSNSSDLRAAGKPRSPSSASRMSRRTASPPRGSMPTTPSIRPMPRGWVWTWSVCPSPSRHPRSRASKSRAPWRAPAPWTCWWWTRRRRWFPSWNWKPASATTLPACTAACWRRVCGSCVTRCCTPAPASCFSTRCAIGPRPRREKERPAPAARRSNFSPRCASR